MPRREGQFLVQDLFINTGGLNTAESPFVVAQDECSDGQNFEYITRGGIKKRAGHTQLNTAADTQLKTIGLGLFNQPGQARALIRAASTKIQNFDLGTNSASNLTEDTSAAGSDFFASNSIIPVVSSMFTKASNAALWLAGGGLQNLYGVYSTSKVTANGVPAPTGTSSATAGGTGGTLPVGTYRYCFVYRKASTQSLSNAALEVGLTSAITAGQNVTLSWTLSNLDTTKYDKIYVYRSAAGGAQGFTTGELIAELSSSTTSYVDSGSSISPSENIPRAGSTIVDNSPLPIGNYNCVVTFKRRLVCATGTTLYISDVDKPESWPTAQVITVPSGGGITGLSVISSVASTATGVDEYLVIFKQNEVWVLTGDGSYDSLGLPNWSLQFLDHAGCSSQSLAVPASGCLFWIAYRGVYMWNGSSKPVYISEKIEDKFQSGGDIDKSKLSQGWGVFLQNRNQIQWYLSSISEGTQKYCLKLDLKQTLAVAEGDLGIRRVRGVFTPDVTTNAIYAALSCFTSESATDETIYLGDDAGFVYSGFSGLKDGSSTVTMQYTTPFLNLGSPNDAKRVHKVVAWVLDSGPYDLTLDYWSAYRYAEGEQGTIKLAISPKLSSAFATWDSSKWDTVVWDGSANQLRKVTFNLAPGTTNANEGETFRFRFTESSTTTRGLIYGFSIYYSTLSLRA